MPDNLAADLPPVKPWEQRRKSMWPLAGGAEQYLDTLEWILRQCQASDRQLPSIAAQYGLHFGLNERVATKQVEMLRGFGLLDVDAARCVPSSSAVHWLETGRSEIVIGAIHANMRLVGELLAEMRRPRSRKQLWGAANDGFGLRWKTLNQVAYRLNWLRSAGFAEKLTGNEYEATDAGLAFLKLVDMHPPGSHSTADQQRQSTSDASSRPHTPGPPRPPKIDPTSLSTSISASASAGEIAQRIETLSCDGTKHKEFEAAVRDAFDFLGFHAELRSGPNETDVLVRGSRSSDTSDETAAPPRRLTAVVEVKAVGNGRLTSNQVDLMTIKKHRDQHGADYALIVGPGPAGQLLDYARDESIGVLDSARLAEVVRAQDDLPLTAREYHRLFVDVAGHPAGGKVDLRPLDEARKKYGRLRNLLCGAFRVVSEIDDSDAGKAIPPVVQFALGQQGVSASLAEVEAALSLLATPWLDALDLVDEGSDQHLPTTTSRLLAQRLRWLADAFDEETGTAASSAGTG